MFDTEPPAGLIDEVLNAGRSLEGLSEMLDVLTRSPKVWSARLLSIPTIRLVRESPGAAEVLAPRTFDLLGVVQPLGDWSGTSGWLDVMGVLAEDRCLRPRADADRGLIVGVLQWCLSHDHPNARFAAASFLQHLIDFGEPRIVLGDRGAHDLRRTAEGLISVSGSSDPGRHLAEAVELLGSIDRAAE